MQFKEIEFKYSANDVKFTDFTAFCESKNPSKFLHASGWDRFYESRKDPDGFCRHRAGPDSNQLTFKRKTTDKNNFVRTEHNIDLIPGVSTEQIEALCQEFGFRYNTSLFKNCFIYTYAQHIFVYYICYDTDMNELGRFIEIEMAEGYPWESEEHAWNALKTLEQECKALGISAQARIKRSLFEMFRAVE